jgi:hypothetical protein
VSPTAPKADKAREVLDWCRYGHQKMSSDPTALEWVLTWAGTIALLRAVGHALVNDDAKKDARLEKAQRAWWDKLKTAKPKPSIFWDFIERDRNLLLHEAELNVEYLVKFTFTIPRHAPQPPPPPPPIHTYQMSSGCFAGRDTRELVGAAIEWWEKQLNDIEEKAVASSP